MNGEYWDRVALEMAREYHLDPVMAEHKRRVHVGLLREWWPDVAGKRVLKSDLFEEALGGDQVLLDWPEGSAGARIAAVDLSREIVRRAERRLAEAGRGADLAVADARRLPFRDGAFDRLFSCSTLDHFTGVEDLMRGLAEGARILAPGGEMVLLLDNPQALFYPLVRRLERKGMIGFHLGKTLGVARLGKELPPLGFEILDARAVYHIPRVLFTAFLKGVRALRIPSADAPLLRLLSLTERAQGKPGQYACGWYTALHLRKIRP